MAYERRVNEAGLFPNTVHPEKSDFTHCGKQTGFWMNGWRRVTKTGGKYLSIALRPKKMGEHGERGASQASDDGDIL